MPPHQQETYHEPGKQKTEMRNNRRWPCLLTIFGLLLFWVPFRAMADSAMRCQSRLVYLGDTQPEVLEKCGEPDWMSGWDEAPNSTVSRFYDYERDRYKAPESTRGPMRMDVWAYDFGSNRFVRYLHFENGELIRIETGEKGSD